MLTITDARRLQLILAEDAIYGFVPRSMRNLTQSTATATEEDLSPSARAVLNHYRNGSLQDRREVVKALEAMRATYAYACDAEPQPIRPSMIVGPTNFEITDGAVRIDLPSA